MITIRLITLAAIFAGLLVTKTEASDIALTVQPMVFEFNAGYGSEQHASVLVTNPGTKSEQVVAAPMDWRTSRSGDVVLTRASAQHAHSLTRYLRITPASFVLKAGESRDIAVSLKLPADENDSVTALWGGVVFQALSLEGPRGLVPGATLLVYDTVKPTPAHLALTRFEWNRGRFLASIVNDSETYARPLASLRIMKSGRVIREDSVPMNVFFPRDRRVISIPAPAVSAGYYDVDLIIQYGSDDVIDGAAHVRIP